MGGGGAMLKPVAAAAAAGMGGGPSDPLPRATATNLHSQQYPSSSSSSNLNLPVSANCSTAAFSPTRTKSSCLGETLGGGTTRPLSMDGREDKRASGSYSDSIFGPVPSRTEVEKAISDLQSFMVGFRTAESEWLQRMLCLYGPRILLQSLGYQTVYDAFRLLQTEPSVQRMVISISSDKAVWNAILNNEVVRNLRHSLCTAIEEERSESSGGGEPDLAELIVKWILDITKAMVLELFDKFSSLVSGIFQPPEKKNELAAAAAAESETSSSDPQLDVKLGSSLLLSIVILLIVVVTRAHGGA